jgi:anti-sigma factor RsiW
MRRRTSASGVPDDAGGAPTPTREPEREPALLTAYVDGIAELSPDERRGIEARLAGDPRARADEAAVRTLLDQLRSLPAEGSEPDWMAMERSIRQAVGHEVPRPWWRRWRWIAPAAMLATAAAVLLVMWARPASVAPPDPPVAARSAPPSPAPRTAEQIVPLWLDGAEVDVDLSASDMLGDTELGTSGDEDPAQSGADIDEVALLPATDLAWIDRLDDAAIDRAERWLARKKG